MYQVNNCSNLCNNAGFFLHHLVVWLYYFGSAIGSLTLKLLFTLPTNLKGHCEYRIYSVPKVIVVTGVMKTCLRRKRDSYRCSSNY